MIPKDLICRLAQSLRRVRTGEGTTSEVLEWLRVSRDAVADVPMPQTQAVHRDYTRTLLFKNESFEVLALHWRPNSKSAIHDHGGALCWLSVARGSIGVENYIRCDKGTSDGYASVTLEGREELSPGAVDYRQDDIHLHRCIARDGEAITLHVYAHPVERFHTFDERANTCNEVLATYDAVLTAV
jgi:predicted metal-dependent enzyme (double-stranded beta helix superfamily)